MEEALITYQQAYNILKKSLPKNDNLIVQSLNIIAFILKSLGRYEEAIKRYDEVLILYKSIYPDGKNFCISQVLNNIAIIYKDMGNFEKALEK